MTKMRQILKKHQICLQAEALAAFYVDFSFIISFLN